MEKHWFKKKHFFTEPMQVIGEFFEAGMHVCAGPGI